MSGFTTVEGTLTGLPERGGGRRKDGTQVPVFRAIQIFQRIGKGLGAECGLVEITIEASYVPEAERLMGKHVIARCESYASGGGVRHRLKGPLTASPPGKPALGGSEPEQADAPLSE